jgi:predicted RNA-binding protein with PUA-like domain
MKQGDLALYYHSNAEPSAVAGIVEVVREAYPDTSAWDPRSDYHDPKASPDNPIWSMVDVKLVEIFSREISLEELRDVKALAGMELLRRGSRLSVHPVTPAQFRTIQSLASKRPAKRT